jgi:flagellar hook-length control protein FliK
LIQLSIPIQTAIPIQNGISETESSHLDDYSSDSLDHLGQAEKKDGPGIFAKILESLVAKNKAAESEDVEDAGDKSLPVTELTNTSNRLLPEGGLLSIEQTIDKTKGLSPEETVDLSIDQPTGQSIVPLDEPGIWTETQIPLMAEELDSIDGELRLMEALLAHDQSAKQAGVEQADDEGVTKGRELVHTGVFPREIVIKEESPAEDGERSALPIIAEETEEGRFFKAEANEDFANLAAKLAAKKARSLAAALSENTESGASQVKYQTASLDMKLSGENVDGKKGSMAADSRKKGKERINVEFLDLRTEGSTETGNVRGVTLSSQGQTPLKPELEISVDLNVKAANSEAGKAGNETYQGRVFEDALARELRGDLSADIVRDATVIARNGGEGTIRLTLHPASMGNVKVRLEMTENKITALIVVESDEALKAFQRELPVLEKAFRDSGFSETTLEMSLAQDERNFGGQEGRGERDFPALASVAASRYEADSGWIETDWIEALPPLQGGTGLSAWPERIPVNLLI